MVSDEHDPDVVKWGLELFESDPYLNCGFQGDSFDRLSFEGDGRDGSRNFNNVNYVDDDEDEVIAYALALSQLRVEDGVEMPEQCDEYVEEGEVGALPQDWVGGLLRNYSSDQEDCEEVTGSVEPSSSCTTSPGEEAYQDAYSLELMDGSVFDSEAAKWLNELIPIPHIPRINGEIPSVDEATLDHQRLLDRLQVYDLVEHKVQGDGNCQFRALSHQFYRTPEHHIFVRQQVVNQLKSNPENYGGYVPMAYDDYLEKMSKNGEWGDHVTLQAAADSYGVKIIVITSFKDTCYIEILPNVQRSNRVILLSFWAEVHYNSISPQGDVPAFEPTKKKKSRRRFRNKHLGSSNENINELRTLTS